MSTTPTMLKFKKGLFENLPSTYSAGTVYITTDEQAMYVDISDSKRIRLSDIIQVSNVTELASYAPDYSTTALYYIIDSNALVKYTGDGTTHSWKQINSTADADAAVVNLKDRVDKIDGSITALNTAVAEITKEGGAIDTAKQAAIDAAAADATSKANTAEANAKGYTDDEIGKLTTIVDGKVNANTFTETVNTLETKADAAQKLTDAKTHAETKASAAETAAKAYTDEKIGEVNTEVAKKATSEELNEAVNGLTAAIGTAKDEAIADAKNKADAAQSAAEATAKKYTDDEIDKIEETINGINVDISGKVDATVFENAINDIIRAETGKIAVAEKAAKDYADGVAAAAQSAAETTAKGYTDAEIVKVNAEVAKKANASDVANTVAGIETAISNAQSAAEAKAAELADAAKSGAETTAANALSAAKTELEGKINGKVGQDYFDSTVSTLNESIQGAKDYAKNYADEEIAKALQDADAMTFIGVLGGEGNIQALPAAEDTKAGDTYKIGAVGTYTDAQIACRVGDLLIAKEDGKAEYWHVSSGYEAENNPTLAKGANDEIVLTSPVGVNLGSIAFTTNNPSTVVNVAHVYNEVSKTTQATVTIGMQWEEF